ncbi:MAG: hypothetical protein K6E59_04790 [Bacilli bacterium]|nr:hypothetical protein [Bacilli bacterium]
MRRRTLPLFCLLGTLLASCSKATPYGEYEFRLGKTDGSHIGISAFMSEESYDKVKDARKMTVSASLGADFTLDDLLKNVKDKYPFVEMLLEAMEVDTSKSLDPTLEGYYVVTDQIDEKNGTRIRIGSDFLKEFIVSTIGKTLPDLPEFSLEPEVIESVVTAYWNQKSLTFRIPVSFSDVQQQLLWYGHFIDFDSLDEPIREIDLNLLPGPKGESRFGVHPVVNKTVNEVALVNEALAYDFSHTPLYQTTGEERDIVGALVAQKNSQGKRRLYARLSDTYEGDLSNLALDVAIKDQYGLYLDTKTLRFSMASKQGECLGLIYNEKEGKEEGFDDGKEAFTFDSFMREAFVFRDFHDVDVSLAKK